MASVSTEQGGDLNVDLNLVPFIDLLSTLTLFLLVTAVWLQIASVPASVDSHGQAVASASPESKIEVRVTPQGFNIKWPSQIKVSADFPNLIPKQADGYNTGHLIDVMKSAVNLRHFAIGAVAADDSVDYGVVVQAVDALKQGGLQSVALSTE